MQIDSLERSNFNYALVISMFLHGVVALCSLLVSVHAASTMRRERLQIELFGMNSVCQTARQMEGTTSAGQKIQATTFAPEKKTLPPREFHLVTKDSKPKQTLPTLLESDPNQVRVASTSDVTPVLPPMSAGAVPKAAAKVGAEAEQRQQMTAYQPQVVDKDAKTREYIAWVVRQVNAHLIYPKEMRKHGIEGVCRVTFTILPTGEIREHSLRVQHSSGHAEFDSSALKVVTLSAPFRQPPQELTLSIDVSFDASKM